VRRVPARSSGSSATLCLPGLHNRAVGGVRPARGSVDADLPKRAVIALLGLPSRLGVLAAMVNRVGGVAVKFLERRIRNPWRPPIIAVRRLREAGALVTRMI